MKHHSAAQLDPSRLLLLRRLCWAAVLSHGPMVAALCELAAADRWRTNGAVTTLCAMYRRMREGGDDPGAPPLDHEAALERLVAAIADADTDDLWLDRVVADIVSLQQVCDAGDADGEPRAATGAHVRAATRIAYLTSVRASYFVLGVERQRVWSAARSLRGLPRG